MNCIGFYDDLEDGEIGKLCELFYILIAYDENWDFEDWNAGILVDFE